MKKEKLLKTLLFPSLGLTILLPTISLTSCSTISQYLIPVVTTNPFTNLPSLIDPYAEYGRYNDTKSVDKTNIHFPTQYIYTSAFNNSYQPTISGQYGFTNAITPSWSYKSDVELAKTNPWLFDENQANTYNWYSTGDQGLQYFDGSNLSSYENLVNYSAIYGVNSISTDLVSMMNYIYIYLNQMISQPKDKVDTYLSVALTNSTNQFNHGNSSSDQNNKFYQFLLSNANVISTGNSAYKFGTYQLDWNIKQYPNFFPDLTSPSLSLFIPLENEDLSSKFGSPANDKQAFLVPKNYAFSGEYIWNDSDNKYEWRPYNDQLNDMSPYCRYSYDENGKPTEVASIANVPVLIHLNTLSSSYYNPTKRLDSIQPTDWVNTNATDVSNAINKSHAWDQFIKQDKVDKSVTNLSSTDMNLNLKDDSASSFTNYDNWWWDNKEDNKIDPNIKEWVNGNVIQQGDFILLANYSFITIDIKYEYKDNSGSIKTTHFKTKIPYFSGFGGFYPAYMLFTSPDVYMKINDKDDSSIYCIDGRMSYTDDKKKKHDGYLYKTMSEAMKHLTTHNTFIAEPENYESNNNAFINNPNMLLYWLFATKATNYTSSTSIDTNDWFHD